MRGIILIASVWTFTCWPVATVLMLWAVVLWLAPRAYRDRQQLSELRATNRATDRRLKPLQSDLNQAHRQIAFLEQALRDAARAEQPTDRPGHPIYRRVGLDQDCPKWVAEVARREYRKCLHPASKKPEQRVEAER